MMWVKNVKFPEHTHINLKWGVSRIPLTVLRGTFPTFMQMLIIPIDKINLPLVIPMLFQKSLR